jgi:hypothetical protein
LLYLYIFLIFLSIALCVFPLPPLSWRGKINSEWKELVLAAETSKSLAAIGNLPGNIFGNWKPKGRPIQRGRGGDRNKGIILTVGKSSPDFYCLEG